jgi:hypothetical protein
MIQVYYYRRRLYKQLHAVCGQRDISVGEGGKLRLLEGDHPAFTVIVGMALLAGMGTAAPMLVAAQSPDSVETAPKGHYAALNALPDWGGTWTLSFEMPKPGGAPVPPPQPALKGKYLEKYLAWQRAAQKNHGEAAHRGSYCTPPGMPVIMMSPQYPIEFLFNPGRVTTHHEAWMQWRNIYTDGRGHSADADPTFNGESIGHWEGTTLVVDTVGIKDTLEIGMGMKHSAKLHIIEHIHLSEDKADTLVDEMTLEDPLALAKPWSTVLTFKRSRGDQLLEFICEENDRNPVDASGNAELK